jgi:hypothetical protein
MSSLDVLILGKINENPGDLRSEVLRAKSALLYGDKILVKSHKVPFLLARMAAIARLLPQQALEKGIDRELVEKVAADFEAPDTTDSEARKLALNLLRSDDPSLFFKFPELVAEVVREKGGLEDAPFFSATASVSVENYLRDQEVDWKDAAKRAVTELIRLSDSGVVVVDTGGSQQLVTSDVKEVEDIFESTLKAAFERFAVNRLEHPLLTPGTELDFTDPAQARVVKRANRAELAASMIADIPSFPHASVDEILDIRNRVSPYLSRFRAVVADLEEELNENIDGDQFAAEVEEVKLRRVAPALDELRESLRDEGLGATTARSAPILVPGVVGLGASVAMGAPAVANVLALAVGATTAVAKEIVERSKLDRERKKHQLFLLFDIERRLSGKG